jgi:cytochrome b subunit of formate dehydrogenase
MYLHKNRHPFKTVPNNKYYGQAKNEKWMTVFATVSIVVLLVFGVVRNIPYFEFLRPL